MRLRLPKSAVVAANLAFFVLIATGCSVVKSSSSSNATASVGVVAFSTDFAQDGTPLNPRNFFPPNVKEVDATVVLKNAKPGMKISGRWYQLGTADSGPDGQLVAGGNGSGDQTLDDKVVNSDTHLASVIFKLIAPANGLPEDSWVLRVYQDDKLIKTYGFIVTRAATTPAPATSAPPVAPTPTAYTVVAGDTLASIAVKFKVDVNALAQLNQLTPTSAVAAGRVLQIPPTAP